MLADLIVLDQQRDDGSRSTDIEHTNKLMTMLGGEIVYDGSAQD